jgi:hypothetical protein
MALISLEQALYGSQDTGGYRFLARSPGFVEDWLPEAQRICTAFGERPAGVACPACLFAQPLDRRYVAIVQVADQGQDDAGRPGALGFHLLVLSRRAYAEFGGDPFLLAERFPPDWLARGELPALVWNEGPPPQRTVEQVQDVLKRAEDGPSLLGGSQALVDGGRLVFERSGPDTELMRGLWTLLPYSTRSQLWPASFAFGNTLSFDAVVSPHARGPEYAGYLTEDQAAEYPEGRYEYNLQVAAEAGDQGELDSLFARRSRAETWRLGLILLGLLVILVPLSNWLLRRPEPPPAASAAARLELPSESYPTLSEPERQRVTKALHNLADQLQVRPLSPDASAEELLTAISNRLGTPDKTRDPGEDLNTGRLKRRLRVLLWKHHVQEYANPKLNPEELVERLQQKVTGKAVGESQRHE